jgi:two-component system catabolic regulation response regulator CreB
VLIVEDDPDIARLFRLILQSRFAVDMALNLAAARAAVAGATAPDVILLDLSLPDGNGLDFCREVKAAHLDLPIVVVTANRGAGHRPGRQGGGAAGASRRGGTRGG